MPASAAKYFVKGLSDRYETNAFLVDGTRIVYRVNGSAEQLRTQLILAKLQEIPAGEAPARPAVIDGTQPAVAPEPQAQLRFRW